jgi:hypothetical protein
MILALTTRIEDVAQGIADQVDRDDEQQKGDARE